MAAVAAAAIGNHAVTEDLADDAAAADHELMIEQARRLISAIEILQLHGSDGFLFETYQLIPTPTEDEKPRIPEERTFPTATA